jgi:hypothetical protein
MRWLLEFYSERRGILARYGIEAPTPVTAIESAWRAVRAEHPPERRRGRPSLLERADRAGGQDGSGWVLYRIARDSAPGEWS